MVINFLVTKPITLLRMNIIEENTHIHPSECMFFPNITILPLFKQ